MCVSGKDHRYLSNVFALFDWLDVSFKNLVGSPCLSPNYSIMVSLQCFIWAHADLYLK